MTEGQIELRLLMYASRLVGHIIITLLCFVIKENEIKVKKV